MNNLTFRCSRGHLFTASLLKMLLLSVHFGATNFTRCPVDPHWGMVTWVNSNGLSESELAEAKRHRF